MKVSKYLKAQKKRQAQKLATHLETLGAAFCREQEIPPGEAMLISRRREDGSTEYFFERKIEKVNMSEIHPDIQYMAQLAWRLIRGPELTKDERAEAEEFTKKYEAE